MAARRRRQGLRGDAERPRARVSIVATTEEANLQQRPLHPDMVVKEVAVAFVFSDFGGLIVNDFVVPRRSRYRRARGRVSGGEPSAALSVGNPRGRERTARLAVWRREHSLIFHGIRLLRGAASRSRAFQYYPGRASLATRIPRVRQTHLTATAANSIRRTGPSRLSACLRRVAEKRALHGVRHPMEGSGVRGRRGPQQAPSRRPRSARAARAQHVRWAKTSRPSVPLSTSLFY